ncbi:unnamed protein product, partial [Mycena citricolor]
APPLPRMFLCIYSYVHGTSGSSVRMSARHVSCRFLRSSLAMCIAPCTGHPLLLRHSDEGDAVSSPTVSLPMAFSLPHGRPAFLAPVDAQPGQDQVRQSRYASVEPGAW